MGPDEKRKPHFKQPYAAHWRQYVPNKPPVDMRCALKKKNTGTRGLQTAARSRDRPVGDQRTSYTVRRGFNTVRKRDPVNTKPKHFIRPEAYHAGDGMSLASHRLI